MADDSQQEKTEQASDKRRKEFREKGQVAQSREVQTAALLTSSLLLWFFYAPFFWKQLSAFVAAYWRNAGEFEITQLSTVNLLTVMFGKLALLMAPPLLLTLVVGFFASFLQVGWLFTAKPLIPDFSKLDPIQGAQKFISKRSLVEIVKSLAKVTLVGVIAFKAINAEFEGALYLIDMDVTETVRYVAKVGALVLLKSSGVLILLALFDFLFVRWEMEQKMKMSKQEQKEEFKETEGDPYIKSRIRAIQQQVARRRMMAEVPKADVIITNPTHLSIALSYRRGEMDAPQVVAKGADHLAMRIREIARENNVPMVENVPVARALYKVDIGRSIPEDMFKAVAEILAYVYNLKRNKG